MSKNSHGYGATGGSGRLPKPTFSVSLPPIDPSYIKFAAQVKSIAHHTKVPVLNVIERARMEGRLECDDETALAIAEFADKLKPLPL